MSTGMNGILDVDIIYNSASTPSGWKKLPIDLNQGAGGDFVYLIYRNGFSSSGVTNLTVIISKNDKVSAPAGYTLINKDLNSKAEGNYIFLCKKIETNKPIIQDIWITTVDKPTKPDAGYIQLPFDLNSGAGGSWIYLWVKYSDQREFCSASVGNMGLQSCKDMCANGGCDTLITNYCNQFPDDESCGCINSKANSGQYDVNVKCVEKKCYGPNVFMTDNMRESTCPSIITCTQQVNYQNNGISLANIIPMQMNCGSGESTSTTPTQTNTETQTPAAILVPALKNFIIFIILLLIIYCVYEIADWILGDDT